MIRPILFSLDAETAHHFTLSTLAKTEGLSRTMWGGPPVHDPVQIGPLTFANSIGLAAGLDKDGVAIPFWPALGFGFIEVGTVTAHPQEGNPKPRLFRLKPERALLNRMGFNNAGSEALANRMRLLREADQWPSVPVGANIGKSKITPLDSAVEDYILSVNRLKDLTDYFTVNVSSPNTPGLRQLQSAVHLKKLLGRVVPAAGPTPVLVKLSPDLAIEDLQAAVSVAIETGCTGIIATNTTCQRPENTGRLEEAGGLSGSPLWPIARPQIQNVLDAAGGKIPVVGVGGIHRADQVKSLREAGCAAVQIYSALIFEGPGLIHKIHNDLAKH